MKKTLLLSLSLTSVAISAQHFCGYDHKKAELEAQFPEIKQERENAEMQLQLMGGAANQLKAMGIKPTGNSLMATSQKIYEIPVVVHIIESKNSKDATSKLHLTDEQIQQWIENANKMYATTYGGQYYPEGTGIEGGTVIPVKLVLAKRSPNCEATNGIVRHDASSLEGYNDHGVRSSNATGATEAQVVAFAPQWDTKAYYNMYIVDSFDGNTAGWGLMGYAYYPMSSKYYTFMKASVVTKPNDSTLAHEFAHSMGLDHVFQGANSNGGECPPSTGDETVDNDKVADTEPIQSLLSVNPTPGNDVINPCTNRNYEGGQYNIMNYTFTEKKFTPGQRDRALALFLQYRSSLVNNSLALTEPGTPIETAEATCNPKDIANKGYYRMGPINVSLGTINNTTGNYLPGENNFYVDYTQTTCTVSNVFTDIKANEASTVS
ncbi:MAG: M43 family zinc metalloprotease, partial [Bergeyella zoohelcum]|nr:M43 family zinc metalloprotease [Bergeyella zoohelcum]